MRTCGQFINGEEVFTPATTFDVLAPETGEIFGTCPRAGETDAVAAVEHAKAGFKTWAALPPSARERVLLKAADLMESNIKRFEDLLIDESGSVLGKARFEAIYTAEILRTAGGEARRLYGETFPNDKPNRMSMVIREPVGVVAVVSPYNAPLILLAKMALFALAAGNSVVAKPSEETPMVAVELAKLLHEAGLPAGVFNVLTGYGAEVGAPLCNHPDVNCIAFTGSTTVGAMLGSQAVKTMKRIQLELGGKNPLIVCADIAVPGAKLDVDKAATQACLGAFFHSGQICMASSRIIVEREVADQFIEALVKKVNALKLGDIRDPTTALGPLINQAALDKCCAHQKAATDMGAKVLCGGEVHRGLCYKPTLILEPPKDCDAWVLETFGPLACIAVVDDFEAALLLANDNQYGLSAGVLTNDMVKGMRAIREIRAGSVHVGMHSFQSDSLAPIGGYNMSGLGKSGGHYSMEHFTEQKWASIELGETAVPPAWKV